MVGKIFLFLILLMSVSTTIFAIPNCNNPSETNCKATPGCLWDLTLLGGACKPCDAGSYCENGNPISCSNATSGDFIESDTGAGSIGECYKKLICDNNGTTIQNCRYYQGSYTSGLNVVFLQNDTTTPTAHLEGGLNGICYTNTRKCENFDSIGCTGTLTENATYLPDTEKWNIGACKCTENNASYSDKHCIATKNYTAPGTIPTVATGITYTMSTYYCTGCIAGHYVTPDNIVAQPNCTGTNQPCSCTPVEQGYYIEQCSWGSNSFYNCDSSHIQRCPAGQTTNGPGATSSNECHYGDATNLCDSKGCIPLKDVLTGVSAADWKPY